MSKTRIFQRILTITGVCLAMAWAGDAQAATRTWDGDAADGDWFNPANWDGNTTFPAGGDEVVITATGGGVTLTNPTAWLASFSIGTNTLTFTDTTNLTAVLQATNVYVRDQGTVTHAGNTDTAAPWLADNRVYIQCSNLTVNAGGSILANSNGYGPGPASQAGYGPGGGASGDRGGGGGYGGKGGQGRLDLTATGGPAYGAASAPDEPGSGGGAKSGQDNTTGWGGGWIRIDADGLVTVNGTVSANGGAGTFDSGGGGSGGGIHISCGSIAGAGTVRASGGTAPAWGAGGGGGRITIGYDAAQQAAQNATAAPGLLVAANPQVNAVGDSGRPGTFHLTDNSFLSSLRLQSMSILGPSSWGPDHLNVTNKWLIFSDELQLTVTNLVLVGTSGILGISNAVLNADTLSITNGGDLYVIGGITNGTTPEWGALISVTGALSIANGCTVFAYSHVTNGGSPLFRAADVDLAAGALIDGDYGGFGSDLGPGAGHYGSGGGYGGVGGDATWQAGGWPAPPYPGGPTCGNSNAPVLPGSGGGARPGHVVPGGALVRIEADGGTVNVDGTITVNGQDNNDRSGGGSGGGIYIACRHFTGGGIMRANGGSTPDHSGGGGGGGRIAIAYDDTTNYSGSATAAFGTGAEDNGSTGTVVWFERAPLIEHLYATNEAAAQAWVVGDLSWTGDAPTEISVFWGGTDRGTDKGLWDTNTTFTVAAQGVVSNLLAPLTPGSLYYYRYYATNAYGDDWADATDSFSTPGGLGVNNAGGATGVTATAAVLNATVTAGNPDPDAYIAWGDSNGGGADTGNWQHVTFGGTLIGDYSVTVSNLTANKTYYYRAYVTNASGDAWASSETNFTAESPDVSVGDAQVTEGAASTTTQLIFTVSLSATSAVPVSVDFSVSNGSASAGSDYVETNGTVTVPAGDGSKDVVVTVNGDGTDEYPSEDLWLVLSNAVSGAITDGLARGVIMDDDDLADTRHWTGSGNWKSAMNWTPIGIPSPADTAVIESGSVVLSNAVTLAELVVSNTATLTMENWDTVITASVVTVRDTATLTHAANTDTNAAGGWTPDARVHIVCSNLTVEAGAAIHGDSKGYGPGPASQDGYGPGGGIADAGRGGGAGHGGLGGPGRGSSATAIGPTYGSSVVPTDPGSGGGAKSSQANTTGWGGGLITIDADGLVTVDGTVSANGGPGLSDSGGGGSGGGIHLSCSRITGSGAISANGGAAPAWGGPGGGGRVAIGYDPAQQAVQNQAAAPSLLVSANHEVNAPAGTSGRPGTVHLTDNSFLSSLRLQSLWLLGATNWAPDHLNVTNKWLIFSDGFELSVTNDLLVSVGGILEMSNATALVGGDVTVTNASRLVVRSGVTNGATPDYGALVTAGGRMSVANGCTVFVYSHPTNGGSPLFRVHDLVVDGGATFDADEGGFAADLGPGAGHYGSGGGYGGAGGDAASFQDAGWPAPPYPGGGTYGVSNAPVHPGSGGGARPGHSVAGGGLVRIEANHGTVTVDGTVTAGGQSNTDRSGGGSGGGIYILCGDFQGAGVLSADGGSTPTSSGGGGGGGRIAVLARQFSHTVTATTDGGTGAENDGGAGTIVFGTVQEGGTLFIVR